MFGGHFCYLSYQYIPRVLCIYLVIWSEILLVYRQNLLHGSDRGIMCQPWFFEFPWANSQYYHVPKAVRGSFQACGFLYADIITYGVQSHTTFRLDSIASWWDAWGWFFKVVTYLAILFVFVWVIYFAFILTVLWIILKTYLSPEI